MNTYFDTSSDFLGRYKYDRESYTEPENLFGKTPEVKRTSAFDTENLYKPGANPDPFGIEKRAKEAIQSGSEEEQKKKQQETTDFLKSFVNKQQQQGSSTSVSGGQTQPIGDGSSILAYPMLYQSGGQSKSGLGSALRTLAGIGASFIPGLGPGIAAALPTIGGTVGSMF